MAIILYAITRDGYFCRKESADHKTDNLDWMRVSTDRQLFRELTTLFAGQTILVGGTTAAVLPPLRNRNTIILSRNSATGMDLTAALNKYPNAMLIGGGTVIKQAMTAPNIEYINSIITVRLPMNVIGATTEYEPDPLATVKKDSTINKSSEFFIHTAKNPADIITMEIWRTASAKTKN